MNNLITYQQYNKNFYEQLLNFLEQVDVDFYPPISKRRPLKEYLALDLTSTSKTFLAINIDSAVIGFINLQYNQPSLGECFINTIAVHKDSRGQGVGSKLLDLTEKVARDMVFNYIKTRTWSTNNSGLALYNKFGFVTDYIVANDRGNNIDSVYLLKKLI